MSSFSFACIFLSLKQAHRSWHSSGHQRNIMHHNRNNQGVLQGVSCKGEGLPECQAGGVSRRCAWQPGGVLYQQDALYEHLFAHHDLRCHHLLVPVLSVSSATFCPSTLSIGASEASPSQQSDATAQMPTRQLQLWIDCGAPNAS